MELADQNLCRLSGRRAVVMNGSGSPALRQCQPRGGGTEASGFKSSLGTRQERQDMLRETRTFADEML